MHEKLIAILKRLANKSQDKGFVLGPTTDLFESGLVDSLTLIQLVVEIEKDFGVQFKYTDIKFENFVTVEKIANLLRAKYNIK